MAQHAKCTVVASRNGGLVVIMGSSFGVLNGGPEKTSDAKTIHALAHQVFDGKPALPHEQRATWGGTWEPSKARPYESMASSTGSEMQPLFPETTMI
ncbi:hypothetical protein NL676_031776 [Syzygium grande]|nr:hypothetical protein NL676_031776 [Syzygium grande]